MSCGCSHVFCRPRWAPGSLGAAARGECGGGRNAGAQWWVQCGWGSCVPNREVKPAGRGPKVQGTEQECSREEPEEEPARRGKDGSRQGQVRLRGGGGRNSPRGSSRRKVGAQGGSVSTYVCCLPQLAVREVEQRRESIAALTRPRPLSARRIQSCTASLNFHATVHYACQI